MAKTIFPTKKYSQLVSTARELFMKYGIRRVSIEEICKTSSVSKVTFYKYFSNKEDLAYLLIKEILEEGDTKYHTIMNQDIPFPEKIEQFIKFKLKYGKQFSKEFYLDWISYSPKIQHMISEWSARTQAEFITMLEKAQKDGHIRKSVSIGFITYFLNKINEMVKDPVLLELYADTYTLTRDLTSFFFYGIMEKRE